MQTDTDIMQKQVRAGLRRIARIKRKEIKLRKEAIRRETSFKEELSDLKIQIGTWELKVYNLKEAIKKCKKTK